jgi:rfaE bifunctional protein kinase chain/domain/rfaE bifunctional protein nucleotidyltransferase chain/domain
MPAPEYRKVLDSRELNAAREKARRDGKRVVQCHGCFDLVHPGHIRHLRFAKSQGDVLLVSITADSFIRKGAGRPLIPQELRAENLAALDFVDWVHIDEHETALDLLSLVRPDVYIKGREYEFNDDPRFRAERRTVESAGGRVVFSSGDVVFSSTALIAAMEHSVDPFHARLAQLLDDERVSGARLGSVVSAFRGKRVVVVGEPILDTYVLCDRPDIAGESPIMTLRPLESRKYDGGAAVIARHLAALGASPVLVAPVPQDEGGRAMAARLAAEGIELRALPVSQPLAEKQRFIVGAQKLMKLDLVRHLTLDAAEQDTLVGMARDAAGEGGGSHAAIIADFGLGLFTPGVLSHLCGAVRDRADVLAGDVSGKRSSLTAMRAMDLLCPSESELREATRLFGEGLPAVAWKLLEATASGAAIVTMGAEGLIAFERLPEQQGDGWVTRLKAEHVPALCPMALDPLGCGDALLATATLTLACGGDLLAAAFLGACAAGVQVQRLGNLAVTSADLRSMSARVHATQLAYAGAEVLESGRPRVLRAPPALREAS